MGYFYDKKVLSFIKTEFLPANLQEKVITPQNQTRFITPDVGYSALSKVTLNGILVDTHQSYTSQTDRTVAYQKTTPTGALKYASLDKVGGMSWKINQLVTNGNFETNSNWGDYLYASTISISNGVLTATTNNASNRVGFGQPFNDIANHKYLFVINLTDYSSGLEVYGGLRNNEQLINLGFNTFITTRAITSNEIGVYSPTTSVPNASISCNLFMLFDLTTMGIDTTDVSVATAELLKRGIDITQYNEYNEGRIRDSLVTSVNGTTLTKNDDVEYGYGINENCYNYRDYINNKGHKVVKRVDLGSLNYDLANLGGTGNIGFRTNILADMTNTTSSSVISNLLNVIYTSNTFGRVVYDDMSICIFDGYIYIHNTNYSTKEAFKTAMSGVYLYYELETEVIEDINAIDNIDVSGGTTTFNNTYHQAVPSEITYLVGATE